MPNKGSQRDTIVIGASLGGVGVLRGLLSQLPQNFSASVFIVQHQLPISGRLGSVLANSSTLPVITVDSSQPIQPGHVYIAAPDLHLMVQEENVVASRGARENRSRPSINVLFRSAAACRGSRVIGVLLTGLLDDGVVGLDVIHRCGGVTIAQDPNDAEAPDLPRNALQSTHVDQVLPIAEIAQNLITLAGQAAEPVPIPKDISIEASMLMPVTDTAPELSQIGTHMPFACPECGGPLWQVGEGEVKHFRCHTGHALSGRALLASQSEEIEHSLWAAVRALTERAMTLNKLAEDAQGRNSPVIAEGFKNRAAEAQTQANRAREFLLSLRMTYPDEKSQ